MRVYHFLNRKYGLQALRRRRLKIARIDQLNDPFELLGFAGNDPEIRRAFNQLKAGLAAYSGLLCFSGRWSNPVQWSHYAERHAGLCLGFDAADHMLVPVDYRSTRLRPDPAALAAMANEGPEAHAMMRRLVTTKFSHWRYENEYRMFAALRDADASGRYFFDFCEGLVLREVIVGSASTVTRAELARALGRARDDVAVFKARLAFKTFRVVRQRRDSLWP